MRFVRDRNAPSNLLRQPGIAGLVRDVADTVADDVRAASETLAPDTTVESGMDRTRAYARVIVDNDAWVPIEYGTTKTSAVAPMRKALERSGLKKSVSGG